MCLQHTSIAVSAKQECKRVTSLLGRHCVHVLCALTQGCIAGLQYVSNGAMTTVNKDMATWTDLSCKVHDGINLLCFQDVAQ